MIIYTVTHIDCGKETKVSFESLNQFTCWVNCLRCLDLEYRVEFVHVNAPSQLEFQF